MAILFLVVLILIAPSSVTAKNFGDLTIEPEPIYVEAPSHGYIDYRFVVVNRATDRGHEVTLEFNSGYYKKPDEIETIRRTVFVAPGAELTVSLFQPCLTFRGDSLRIFVDGALQADVLSVRPVDILLEDSPTPLIFVDRTFDLGVIKTKLSISDKRKDAKLHLTESSSEMKEWPTDWLSYTRYDGVIVAACAYNEAPLEVKEALLRYVEAGGNLLMVGDAKVPLPWQKVSPTRHENLQSYNVGFGMWQVFSLGDLKFISIGEWEQICNFWKLAAEFGQLKISRSKASSDFSQSNISIFSDKTGVLVYFIIFALAIGPVNLWILSRINHKIWIFWTIPAISLITSGGLFLYALLAEGWNIRVRSVSFSILDENSRRVTTLGCVGVYSPFTVSDGLQFSSATEVTPCQPFYQYNRLKNISGREVTWSNVLHLGRGWIVARMPVYLKIRNCDSRRERLTIKSSTDNELEVVNGFGKRIKQLWLSDKSGKIFQGENLEPGKLVKLFPNENRRTAVNKGFDQLRWCYTNFWLSRLEEGKFDWQILAPETYLAQFDACPFFDLPVKKAGEIYEKSFVFGIMKEGKEE